MAITIIHGTNSNDFLQGFYPSWSDPFSYWGKDIINAYDGNDVLYGWGGEDVLFGGNGDDYLWGYWGNDYLHGDAGDDILLGDAGNDSLSGGGGKDILTGGYGADYFYFYSVSDSPAGTNRDVITDFTWQDGDKIILWGIDGDLSTPGFQEFEDDQLLYENITGIFTADVIGGPDLQIQLIGATGFDPTYDVVSEQGLI